MKKFILTVALLLCNAVAGHATIVDYADVNGLHTFQDQTTGRVWLDMNNFFNQTFDQMAATAAAAGFSIANQSDVSQLLATLPYPNANWSSYTSIMGEAPHRNIIWGAYLLNPTDTVHQWAYSFDYDISWSYAGGFSNNEIPNEFTLVADLNIWAYQTSNSTAPVPEPGTIALLGLGMAGLALYGKRKQHKA